MPCSSNYPDDVYDKIICLVREQIKKEENKISYYMREIKKELDLTVDLLCKSMKIHDKSKTNKDYFPIELLLWWEEHKISDEERDKQDNLMIKVEFEK